MTFSLRQEALNGALDELALALPAGRGFEQPTVYDDIATVRITRAFAGATVREALDAVTPPGWAWHLSHRLLTCFTPHEIRGCAFPEPMLRLDTLRAQLLEWSRSGDDAVLVRAFGGISNFYDCFIPASALDADPVVVAAVRSRIATIIRAGRALRARDHHRRLLADHRAGA